jgi:hypothetical protein
MRLFQKTVLLSMNFTATVPLVSTSTTSLTLAKASFPMVRPDPVLPDGLQQHHLPLHMKRCGNKQTITDLNRLWCCFRTKTAE